MLRTNSGVVQTGRYAVCLCDLPVIILQDIGLRAVQNADPTCRQRGSVFAGCQPLPGRLDPDEPHVAVIYEWIEDADGIAAAADAGHHVVRQASGLIPGSAASSPCR